MAEVAPDWLLEQSTPEWGERYSRRFEDYRLRKASQASELHWQRPLELMVDAS